MLSPNAVHAILERQHFFCVARYIFGRIIAMRICARSFCATRRLLHRILKDYCATAVHSLTILDIILT